MTDVRTLPVLPLRSDVIFPGVTVPIAAGREASVRAVEHALAGESLVFAVAQRDPDGDAVPDNLYTVGTVAVIEQSQRGSGGVQMLVRGRERAVAARIRTTGGMLEASVRPAADLPPLRPDEPAFAALLAEVRERAVELAGKAGLPREAIAEIVARAADPGALADLVAASIEAPLHDRQGLIETTSVEDRLRRVLVMVQRQLAVLEARADIRSKVQQELGERQRQVVLREQLRAIQRELGEDGGDDRLDELRQRLESLELPEAARSEVDRELARLARLGPDSMESQVVRTFLENVAELPWNEEREEVFDLAHAERVLDEDHHGLTDVKDRVLEFLAVRKLQARETRGEAGAEPRRSPILLFVGPPGVGKTSIARSIARATGRDYVRVALGGARDQADITGHRRTYVGAMPGRILQGMRQAGSKNPVFLLDEVDKLGVSFQGDPASALLEVLDPAQNDSFTDHYLGLPFDLSGVLFVATANDPGGIPRPLLDRMEVVEFTGYTEVEKLAIARSHLLPRQLRQNGLEPGELAVDDDALGAVIGGYTREAGVRQLEREIGKLIRKAARRIAAGETFGRALRPAAVRAMLGRPRVRPERAASHDTIGVATGMYYTPAGGDIMFVEATAMPGSGKLVLTGQLGDVMRESARAAHSYARAHAHALRIPDGAFDRDLHIHVPAGAVPKDGPSAGIAMATAIVSALAGRAVRSDIAMTGEITLSGRVLPIGGVKEKVLGGLRAGIRTFLLPAANEADLEDLPESARAEIDVKLVEEIGDALAHTLRDARYEHGHLVFDGEAA